MALTVSERTAQSAEHYANHDNHGYSQPNRAGDGTTHALKFTDGTVGTVDGGDVDCSEMAKDCVNLAIKGNTNGPIGYMWSGNADEELVAVGFRRIPFSTDVVQRGDVLWMEGHMGVALGNGLQADAHGDEHGGISGPRKGDQTGHEVEVRALRSSWQRIYRYAKDETFMDPIACSFKLKITEPTNVRTKPNVYDGSVIAGTLKAGKVIRCDGWLVTNGTIWAHYKYRNKDRYVSLGNANSWTVVS